MKKVFISLMLLAAGCATAQEIYVVAVQPRYVTIQQRQCQMREYIREGSSGSGTIGAVAGGLLGSTIGSTSGDHIAGTVIGALIGGAIGSEVSREPGRIEQREVCSYVPMQIQQGEIVTFNYRGRIFTQTFN